MQTWAPETSGAPMLSARGVGELVDAMTTQSVTPTRPLADHLASLLRIA